MKQIVYVGPDGDGQYLGNGTRLPHGEAVYVPDEVHAALLAGRPEHFQSGEPTGGSRRRPERKEVGSDE